MTITTELEASPDRVWQLWADPRQLERWWGPPSYPATFTQHDLTPGGHIDYYMTGPEGDQPHGYWEVVEVDRPRSILIRDGFAGEDGTPNTEYPVTNMRVRIEEAGSGRSRMTIESHFPSVQALEQMLAMGMEQGLREAVGQIDAILAEQPVQG